MENSIHLRGNHYPLSIQGTGEYPCICIGIGTLMQRTFSEEFLKTFKVYSTDTYWIRDQSLQDPTQLSLQNIVQDVVETARQAGLKNYILIGHSCFGMVAIEAAKLQPNGLMGVAAVASPPRWDPEGISASVEYFETHASSERKANHLRRQQDFEKIRKSNESIVSLNTYEADAAKYFHNYEISRSDLEALWKGIEADDAIMNHFFETLLPKFDLSVGIEALEVPVFLAAGESDFDSTPLHHWANFPHPKDFTIADCGKAGHWPHAENAPVFDPAFAAWARRIKSEI